MDAVEELVNNVRQEIIDCDYEVIERTPIGKHGVFFKIKSNTRGRVLFTIENMNTNEFKLVCVSPPMLGNDPITTVPMFLGYLSTEYKFEKAGDSNNFFSVVITDLSINDKVVIVP